MNSPPPVIRPGKADDELAARVETRQAHRRHDGLGAAHVKRDVLEMRDALERGDVVGDDGMQRAEDRSQVADACPSFRDPVLVAIEAGHVEPVRPAHVEAPVAVEIAQARPVRRGDDTGEIELLPHLPRKRKRHAVGVGESQVGEAVANPRAPRERFIAALAADGAETFEAGPANRHRRGARAIRGEETIAAVVARPDPPRELPRDPRRERPGPQRQDGDREASPEPAGEHKTDEYREQQHHAASSSGHTCALFRDR